MPLTPEDRAIINNLSIFNGYHFSEYNDYDNLVDALQRVMYGFEDSLVQIYSDDIQFFVGRKAIAEDIYNPEIY